MSDRPFSLRGYADTRIAATEVHPGQPLRTGKSRSDTAEANAEAQPVLAMLLVHARIFDRYVLAEQLPSTIDFARYLAQDEIGHQMTVVTLARVSPQDGADESHPLLQASRRLRRLPENGHVVRITATHCGRFDGLTLVGVAQEHADGEALRDCVSHDTSDGTNQDKELRSLFRQMALGVAELHAAGIAGLGLRAEHFVCNKGVLKLDGLACLLSTTPLQGSEKKSSDVRSLARILGGLFPAHRGIAANDLDPAPRGAHAERNTISSSSRHFCRVLECCLSSDPRRQFEDALELVQALEDESMAWDAEDRASRSDAWRDIEFTMASGDLTTAALECELFLKTWPDDRRAQALRTTLQARYADADRLYSRIERELDAGPLGRMLDLLQQAVQLYPDHPSGVGVQIQIASAAREFKNCMRSGVELLKQGAWEASLQCFQRAHALDQGSPPVMRALEFATSVVQHVRTARAEIDDAVRRRDKSMALAHARALDSHLETVRACLPELDR